MGNSPWSQNDYAKSTYDRATDPIGYASVVY